MPSHPKIFFPGGLYFITTSVEEDFMFPPNPLVKELIKKCLAQAQKLHPVEISHLVVTTTHIHFFVRVLDPQDMADFMERFKTESAHAINRLLGRKKRTVWCEGYDSPLIDDLATAQDKIAYIYENPSKDNLEDSIERFPGFTTWRQLLSSSRRGPSKVRYETRYLARKDFHELPSERILTEEDYRKEHRRLIRKKKKNFLEIDCNSWMKRFGVDDPKEQRRINQEIIADLRVREQEHRTRRAAEKKSVLGRLRLILQPVGSAYTPNRTGRRMLTHSNDPEFRKQTIRWMKALIERGREVYSRWKAGDTSLPYPMGLFPPHGVRLVEPIGW